MRLAELQQEAARLMALYAEHVRHLSAMSLTDISAASDMFLVELFRELFDLPGLRNLNEEKSNFSGLDLGDENAGRAFQVTADRSLSKVLDGLQKSIQAGHHKKIPTRLWVADAGRVQGCTNSPADEEHQVLLPMALAGGGDFVTMPVTQHFSSHVSIIGVFLEREIVTEILGDLVRVRVA
jgi:hypothetical protein